MKFLRSVFGRGSDMYEDIMKAFIRACSVVDVRKTSMFASNMRGSK